MDETEIVEIPSGDSEVGEDLDERRKVLEPIVQGVVDALGGQEGGSYRLGDQVSGCLKDLKKLWRKDETDDERSVARIFWKARVFMNDLIPILLVTAGKGMVEDKRAIACADLMTAMTWPIDLAEELKELDEEFDRKADYTILLQSHLHYKAALLKPGVLEALFGIILPPLAKSTKERTERDGQVVNVVLHLIRNLAFIKDLPPNMHLSADQAEFSKLQSRLICVLSETHMLRLLLTIAANSDKDSLFDSWNTVVLEILYLLFRGVQPSSLAEDQSKQPAGELHRLLTKEEHSKRQLSRQAPSRHSRFGTTISVKLNPNKKADNVESKAEGSTEGSSSSKASQGFVLHRQQGISGEAGNIWDMSKRQKARKGQAVDELARNDNLSVEARTMLQRFATDFLEGCFNSFLATLLKDVRAERAKITEKDHLRLLYVTKWFLNFFLSKRTRAKAKRDLEMWNFGLVAEVVERGWIIWVLKRMREAVEEKPKLWTELQAGIGCLTQLLILIDGMSSTEIDDPALREAADVLQQQLIYGGDVLDIALESMRTYKEGTQSLAYLNSSVNMAYSLMKMLEKWSKGKGKRGEMYVRKKKSSRRKRSSGMDEVPDVEDEQEKEEEEDVIHETMFTFETFEMRFANADITHTLLAYLARYREFTHSEDMRRIVSLLHRQAVRAKAEGLFFKVSTLDLFKTILADQKSFPREQPYKDLISLINFILRRFFKALEEEPFLAVEAFFPKNRGNWKQYSSWEPPAKGSKEQRTVEDTRFPPEVRVKKGYSWSDQVGIAIAALVEAGQTELVLWTREILQTAKDERRRIVSQTDENDGDNSSDENDDPEASLTHNAPSLEARAKMKDYLIPYLSDEHADAATKNSHLKLLFRLSKFHILDEDADELEWYVPTAILPDELQGIWNVITQFLKTPIDLQGKKISQLLSKQTQRRRRRRVQQSDKEEDAADEDEPVERMRKQKEKKEEQQYKSAQFIEDSDEEYGDIDAFLELERQRREKTALKAAALGDGKSGAMQATGTKKRRRKAGDKGERKKKRKGDGTAVDIPVDGESNASDQSDADSDEQSLDGAAQTVDEVVVPPSRPRPRPKPRPKITRPSQDSATDSSTEKSDHEAMLVSSSVSGGPDSVELSSRRKGRIVLSDDEDE